MTKTKSLGIGHDWAHCNAEQCALKNSCIRYILHLEAIENNVGYCTYLIPESIGEECKHYWKKSF